MMNKIFAVISLALLTAAAMTGSNLPVERVFVSTDRSVYIAGDMVWCSLFNLDGQGSLSSASAVSYLELVSAEGSVVQAKIGLLEGRGAGSFRIPVTVPTGVYRLVAYTAVSTNEEATPWMLGSRLLTIFNTVSTSRVKDGVEFVEASSYRSVPAASQTSVGKVEIGASAGIRMGKDLTIFLRNGGAGADFSLSVYHEDDLVAAPQDKSMADFIREIPSSLPGKINDAGRPLEYDGEIVSAHIKGKIAEDVGYSITTLSSAGSPSNMYIGVTDNDKVSFMTNNIYGDREIVCEVSRLDKKEGIIEFDDPFIYPSAGSLPKLILSPAQQESLSQRKYSLRNEASLRLDTLVTMMRHREDLLLEGESCHRYHLDDYTRFPSVREVLVEVVTPLSVRKVKGGYSMQMVISDASDSRKFKVDNVLVMMDGVVLSDLNALMNFDAMLLEDVDVYQHAVVCGKVTFSGVVNFITKKNYVTALSFPSNVRVLDFKGVSYPVAYLGGVPGGGAKDVRQVLYWNPCMRLAAGEQQRVSLHAPAYSGRFRVVAEGISDDGTPVHSEWTFDVE